MLGPGQARSRPSIGLQVQARRNKLTGTFSESVTSEIVQTL